MQQNNDISGLVNEAYSFELGTIGCGAGAISVAGIIFGQCMVLVLT